MAERRINCWQCPTYDRSARRCRLGKSNPRKEHEAVTLAEMLGPQALCLHNPYREPLILRMRFADRRFVWSDPPPRPHEPMEVDILEDEGG